MTALAKLAAVERRSSFGPDASGPTVGFKLDKSKFFFDPTGQIMKKGLANASHYALNKFGAYVRTAAQRSMPYRSQPRFRPGKKPSKSRAGKPPIAWRQGPGHPRGPLLRKRIFYYYDPLRQSVITGPELLRGTRKMVPETLEHGGFVTITVRAQATIAPGQAARVLTPAQKAAFVALMKSGRLVKPQAAKTTKVVHIEPHPFMKPAQDVGLAKFPTLYADRFQSE